MMPANPPSPALIQAHRVIYFLLTGMVAVWGVCETPSSPSGACRAIRLGRAFDQMHACRRLLRSTHRLCE
ncbi:hypothetical protein K523DRAFT_325517 [Schizophyllum commune Tattone D]|nr:hypothetical protein K523DRAFT_325517 [Schizophyllum commune Tattone D]